MDTTHPQTQGGRSLKRGDSYDPECSRTSHRLRVALQLLAADGITPTPPQHTTTCGRHPDKLHNVVHSYRERVCCTCGADYRGYTWPEYATGRTFDLAYQLADELQTARGAWHQAAINAERTARWAAEREEAAATAQLDAAEAYVGLGELDGSGA